MPFRMAIKWLHRVVTLTLLLLVIGFWWLSHSEDDPAGDKLLRTQKINDHMWLYMTESQSGGATVPFHYRYYLAGELKGNNGDVVKSLAEGFPFISGSGTIVDISTGANNRVNVTYSGNVLSLSNAASYIYNSHSYTANFSYQIN